MRPFIGLLVFGILISSALADDRNLIQAQMQQMADAVALGSAVPWDRYLDPNVIFAEEDGIGGENRPAGHGAQVE